MRVITGSAKGYTLKVPKSAAIRPTPARAKEAIFSSLGDRVVNAAFLDLFAGSGAFGIEALSRGASRTVFVELDGMAGATLRQNLRFTRLETHALLITADVRDALRSLSKRGEVFDVIFADPPYSKGQGTRNKEQGAKWKAPTDWKSLLLASADLKAVLAPGGALLLEYYKYDAGLDSPHFRPEKEFRFGDTLITLFGHV